MKERQLFKQDFILYQSSHQSHIHYEFFVPKGTEELIIHFEYGPLVEDHYEDLLPTFEREGIGLEHLQAGDSFRNLITLSLNDPKQFRGAHHYFNLNQTISLNSTEASQGFVAGEIHPGNWQVILSCHGIFSNQVKGSIEIIGINAEPPRLAQQASFGQIQVVQDLKDRQPYQQASRFVKTELHAHTIHSDAQQTTQELIDQAVKEGIAWLAISDHNTITAIEEANRLVEDQPIQVIPGLEFTTFYGHFLMHGAPRYLFRNWTEVNLTNVGAYLAYLKENPVNLTIAHPFDQGNPWCTGCRWDYQLADLRSIDAIEIWNYVNPHQSQSSEEAYQQWVQLLAQGYEIAATAGHDWHRPLEVDEEVARSYLLVEENETLDQVLQAHQLGRSYASIRPLIDYFILNDHYQLGDRMQAAEDYHIRLSMASLEPGDCVMIFDQDQLLIEEEVQDASLIGDWSLQSRSSRLFRLEVKNNKDERILFTNPIYLGSADLFE